MIRSAKRPTVSVRRQQNPHKDTSPAPDPAAGGRDVRQLPPEQKDCLMGKPSPTARPVLEILAAPHTPMRGDGAIHIDRVEALAGSLVASGVSGVFVCGSTGEFASLSTDERMQVAQRWVEVAAGRLRVLVHVGHTSIADCRALAEHAQRIGADGIGALAPFFFKPTCVAETVDFCCEVAAAAPELPFYFYHIPARSGVDLPMIELLESAGPRIPTLQGMKFTAEKLNDYLLCLRADGGRYEMFFGRDEMLLAGLALGATAAVGTTYNYAAPLYIRIAEAFAAGDLTAARDDQARSAEMIRVMKRTGVMQASKAMMRMIGVDCGPLRPPMKNLSDEQVAELRGGLERIGFLEWCNRT